MKKKIDWLNHAVSFAVVLTGILIAFKLTEYSENRKQEKTIENHRKGLLQETHLNKENLEGTLVFTELTLKKVDTLNLLIKGEEDLENTDRLSQELLTATGVYFYKKRL